MANKLDHEYLEKAIEEIQNCYDEPVNIPDWLIINLTETGFKELASSVKTQQESMQEYHDDDETVEFDFTITEEMIKEYKESNNDNN